VPYLVGIGKMSFRRYALFSYTTGLVWTLVLFIAGYVLGDNVAVLNNFRSVFNQGAVIAGIILVLAAIAGAYGYRVWRSKRQTTGNSEQEADY
jgi:membrane protein DedA with SNARE-associated domain